ncbi:putative Ketoreductase [Taphrina deformans PYCC 5710]|uniref:Ketoreductase n=1 Tax=Taphrina deformans (strain PYCC 5710 / ATCC 11124 / CBS 356.35 / IMI 108563 / JCM 9778 / NBRC 8474) TaxID=1097556 RepID=R4XFP4_TAPDE|nr:putative Ketoreductase [Taphrina deformans PYCC 5710]|eukprot:CCG82172.1 putative Ketoreductase [Taphrina deformans PYCC 5710]
MKQINRVAYGIGTAWYKAKPGAINRDLVEALKSAVRVGYRHLDNAEVYENEEECGVALDELGDAVGREDLWITTKLKPAAGKDVVGALRTSLGKLRLGYVDAYLIHTPIDDFKGLVRLEDLWAGMEECRRLGLARNIGVSNFRVQELRRILAVAKAPVFCNQVELHPYNAQPDLLAFMAEHKIVGESYSPLVPITKKPDGPLADLLPKLAAKYGKTTGQVLLRWNTQKGNTVITTSSKVDRMKEQLDIFSFDLTDDDIAEIDRLGQQVHHRIYFAEHLD